MNSFQNNSIHKYLNKIQILIIMYMGSNIRHFLEQFSIYYIYIEVKIKSWWDDLQVTCTE